MLFRLICNIILDNFVQFIVLYSSEYKYELVKCNSLPKQKKLCKLSFKQVEFFTNTLQYKNANIANFLFSVLLEINWTNEV